MSGFGGNPVRVIVVGVGVMGQNHARVLSEMGVLAGIVDIDEHRASEVASRYDDMKYTSTVGEMKEWVDFDAAVVATPTVTHAGIVHGLLCHGKDVLVEKPMGATWRQCKAMIECRGNSVLAVGHIERFNPVVRYAKEHLRQGDFGSLISMSAKRLSQRPKRIGDVGVVADLAAHDIDVIRYLAGSEVKRASAVVGKRRGHPKGVEDQVLALLEFDSGVSAHIEASWRTSYKVRQLTLTCSEKLVMLDYLNQTVEVSTAKPDTGNMIEAGQLPMEYAITKVVLKRQEPLRLELEDFVDAVQRRRKPFVTGEEGAENLRVCERILEASG